MNIKSAGAIGVTIVTAALLVWWLFILGDKLSSTPRLDPQGNIILDEWARAKDILLVIVPLFTAAMGYWIGSKESGKAQEETKAARHEVAQLNRQVGSLEGTVAEMQSSS